MTTQTECDLSSWGLDGLCDDQLKEVAGLIRKRRKELLKVKP